MKERAPSCPGKLGTRLNHLFATIHPRGRGPYSNDEVAKAIYLNGGDISKAYIAYLRKGTRNNPTLHHLEALATFFGVKPAYFFDDEVAQETDSALSALVALREAGIRLSEWEVFRDTGITKIAARADGLSPRGLMAAAAIIDQLRALEGLPPKNSTGG
ncbi:helix-turn-helix domain-containing protein [Kitasatospora sp. NPDC091335]|uniref:helix-turn-helix domain-containing protein n=1 Tax=Kitasatospora sp. NPDC091335 TaxID=3364085 RepID=UPI00380ABD7A